MTTRSVVIANAGSGKTYLLANRLIRWMIQERRATGGVNGRASPEQVLAVTFTRKAAGEIMERVLRHLAQGALGMADGEGYSEAAQVGPAQPGEYSAVLRELIDAMHRMSISTIDGFFIQLAGAFGPELGLPEGWRIAQQRESDEQRLEAVGAVIAADPERAVDLAKRISDGRPKAAVQAGIEEALEQPLLAWDRCSLGGDSLAPWRALQADDVSIFPGAAWLEASALDASIAALMLAPLPLTKAGTPVKVWQTAVQRVCQLAREADWFGVLEDRLVGGLLSSGRFSAVGPTPEFSACLQPVTAHASAIVQAVVRARVAATAELAALVDADLWKRRRADGLYGFQEITTLVARAQCLGGEGTQAMRERLDRALRDIALDEFQDTSAAQWTALAPFIDEVLATAGRRFLVVGDPKQSIYAWRGGTPALLASVRSHAGMEPDVELDRSFRSCTEILDFVNELFGGLAQRVTGSPLDEVPGSDAYAFAQAGLRAPVGVERSPLLRALDGWTFVEHRAAVKRRPGLVRAFCAAAGERDIVARTAARVVAERSAKRPRASIAVLASSNDEISSCASAIRALGIAVSDEGRSQLLDSPAVSTVIAFLRLADQPDHSIAHWMVTREPMLSLPGLQHMCLRPMESFGGGASLRAEADRISALVRRQLHAQGLAGWVDGLAAALLPACSSRDAERLQQLSTMAREATDAEVERPSRFVRSIEAGGSRAATGERVRVMTVHASKGLEFDEVVLVSLDRTMGQVRAGVGEWALLTPDPTKPPVAVAPVLSKELVRHSPLLASFRREAEVGRTLDDISAFYVGVTRARQALHMVCQPPSETDTWHLTATRLLRMAFADFEQAYLGPRTPETPFWQRGDPELGAGEALVDEPEQGEAPPPEVEWVARPGARVAPSPSTHARGSGGVPSMAAEFAGAEDGARGSLAHAWFERVEWLDAGFPSDADEAQVLRAVTVEIGRPPEAALRSEVRQRVAAAVAGPLGACLRRERYSQWGCDQLQVRNEMPFVALAGDQLSRGRMDRVVLGMRGGRVVRAEVLDWKTGALGIEGAALKERLLPYHAQMASYRQALAGMFGIGEADVTATLLMVDRGQVIESAGV